MANEKTQTMQDEPETEKTQLKKLWSTGIPVRQAKFHAAVDNADDVPENGYDIASLNKSRRVEMMWTTQGLICRQADAKKKIEYWLVPASTVAFAKFS